MPTQRYRWGAVLKGDIVDLEDWYWELRIGGDPWVERFEANGKTAYLLCTNALPASALPSEVFSFLGDHCNRLNLLLYVSLGGYPLQLNGELHQIDGDELTRIHFIGTPDAKTIIARGGKVRPASREELIDISKVQETAQRADAAILDLLSENLRPSSSWTEIYQAFEIITKPPIKFSREKLKKLGVTNTEINNFTLTAKLHRHAYPDASPKKELSLEEGCRFVRRVTQLYFESLTSAPKPTT